jgi:hypothetical protein
MDAQPNPSGVETFTVKDVRKGKDGMTDGRAWSTYLIFTDAGEMLSSFESDWLLMIGETVSVPVTERVVNGKTYRSVRRPPSRSPGPAVRQARSAMQAKRQQAAQTPLTAAAGPDVEAFVRLEASLELLVRKTDSLGAVLGDVAEGTRTITALLQQRLPIPPEDVVDEPADAPDPEDPGPPEPPELDEAPLEEPDHA